MINKKIFLFSTALICVIIIGAIFSFSAIRSGKSADRKEETMSKTSTEIATEESSAPVQLDINSLEILVNTENPIPEGRETDIVTSWNGCQADRRADEALRKMLNDAEDLGYSPVVVSSYRSHKTQIYLFERKIESYVQTGLSRDDAYTEAAKWVAVPGTSEHETGLAFDIVSSENQVLDESQLKSELQQWLMKNCYNYGFILRYPQDKSDITGIHFEPWHYRYVGDKLAGEIKERNICLEEYYALSAG